jgi:hypothetical protein
MPHTNSICMQQTYSNISSVKQTQKHFQFSMFLWKYVIIIIAFDRTVHHKSRKSTSCCTQCRPFLPGIDNRILYTLGPKPHFLGYVSRSMITRLILATIPWSQPAIVAVVMSAMAEIHTHILEKATTDSSFNFYTLKHTSLWSKVQMSGFQGHAYPFHWVPKLSPPPDTIFSQQQFTITEPQCTNLSTISSTPNLSCL